MTVLTETPGASPTTAVESEPSRRGERPARRVVVVGAGFAGVAAACAIAGSGGRVTLVEARQRGGGRATSFVDPESGETIDNGQHALLGCYAATRRLLRTLGAEHLVRFQKRLTIHMAEPGGRLVRIACPPLPSPIHLLAGLIAMKGLTWADRWSLLRAAPRLMRLPGDGMTVEEWLDALGQTTGLRDRFWRPVAVAALNEDTRVAGAALWTAVLKEAFAGGAAGMGMGLPVCGFHDLYVEPAARFLRDRGGHLITGSPAERIVAGGDGAAVLLRDATELACDGVVIAVPHTAAGRLIPDEAKRADPRLARLADLGASAIVSVNVWLDREIPSPPFLGFIGGTVQFVFNKAAQFDPSHARGAYLACVISAASDLAGRPNEEIAAAAADDLRRYIPAARPARVLRTMVVKEKLATFSGRPEVLSLRPPARTAVRNVALAGDWTDTGLPGSIEGAVRSGDAAARVILGA